MPPPSCLGVAERSGVSDCPRGSSPRRMALVLAMAHDPGKDLERMLLRESFG